MPWLLIALTPVIFALATWELSGDPSGNRSTITAWMRVFGAPVAAVELGVIAYAMINGYRPLQALRSAPAWSTAALLGLIAISFYTSLSVAADPLTALTRGWLWIIHLLFGLSVARLANGQAEWLAGWFWPAFVAGLCGYVLVLAAYVASLRNPDTSDWLHLTIGLTNIRQIGSFSAAGAAAALGVAVVQSRRGAFLAGLLAASILLAVSFWSGTRGSLLAVWVGWVLGMLMFPRLRRPRALAALAGSTALGALLSLVHSVPDSHFGIGRMIGSTGTAGVENLGSGRSGIWAGTWRTILERPWLGHGEGQFKRIVEEGNGWFNHPHNALLQLLLQWGVLGTLLFLALAGLVAWRCAQAIRLGGDRQLPPFLVAASLLTLALYDGALFYTYPVMMIVLSIAAIIGSELHPDTRSAPVLPVAGTRRGGAAAS